MKKLTLPLTLIALATSATFVSTTASAEVSANVAATSNYLWRGLEQSAGQSAISGGIDWADDKGLYAGTWASNIDFGGDETYELDFYAGFAGDISDSGVGYDVGFIYYAYPDATGDADFSEVYVNLSYAGFTLGVASLASADGFDAGDSTYASIDWSTELANGAEIALHLGDYSGDFSAESTDFGASISKDGFTFGVSQVDFDVSPGDSSDEMKVYVSYAIDIEL
ncbi:MAG: TorF family putative porin [Thalassotalea sp.]